MIMPTRWCSKRIARCFAFDAMLCIHAGYIENIVGIEIQMINLVHVKLTWLLV